jgi:AraC-like DNA-binding protein
MFNLHSQIVDNPGFFRQLNCGESLISLYNCPIENKYQDIWSHHGYIVYVVEGRKVWHTPYGSYDLRKGTCVFVRKGASIVEQFFDPRFCLMLFFLTDEFICEVLKTKSTPIRAKEKRYDPIIPIDSTQGVESFFQSMMPHFGAARKPDTSLLELKFRELVLTVADNPSNGELLAYFSSLLREPQSVSLQQIMEENFCFNLKQEEFARLSFRSLSGFKRDFQRLYNTTPGKWLLEKRLNHALLLLTSRGKTVGETAFESGFESPSHFSRAFRQRFGTPPTAAKQQTAV